MNTLILKRRNQHCYWIYNMKRQTDMCIAAELLMKWSHLVCFLLIVFKQYIDFAVKRFCMCHAFWHTYTLMCRHKCCTEPVKWENSDVFTEAENPFCFLWLHSQLCSPIKEEDGDVWHCIPFCCDSSKQSLGNQIGWLTTTPKGLD